MEYGAEVTAAWRCVGEVAERRPWWEAEYDRWALRSRPSGRVADEARRRERFCEFWKELDEKFG